MRIWYGYGSEHSMNLVMIGHFKDAESADEARDLIEQLTLQVNADIRAKLIEVGGHSTRYTEGALKVLRDINFYSISAGELEQFAYDVSIKQEESKLILTTDESDVSAFLKLFVERGARVEVFSAHHYSGTRHESGE
jgi:hypothetical protein